MKTLKDILGLAIVAYLALSVTIIRFLPETLLPLHFGFLGLIVGLLAFNIFARNSYVFKSYFVSKWNVFSEKSTQSLSTDLPLDLIHENLNEIFQRHQFTIRYRDSNHLFATTGMSFRSWGENIYCDIQTNGNQVEVQITSVCLFQHISWGKNDQNVQQLISSFEESLTV